MSTTESRRTEMRKDSPKRLSSFSFVLIDQSGKFGHFLDILLRNLLSAEIDQIVGIAAEYITRLVLCQNDAVAFLNDLNRVIFM